MFLIEPAHEKILRSRAEFYSIEGMRNRFPMSTAKRVHPCRRPPHAIRLWFSEAATLIESKGGSSHLTDRCHL